LEKVGRLWDELRGKRIFITGGTGFFGKWLLESFIWANNILKLNAQMHVLSRDPEAFKMSYPHLANANEIVFYRGDVRTFDFPTSNFEFVIHAATDATTQLNHDNPLLMIDTIIEGTRRVLDFSLSCGAKRFLLISSGAVYGKQPVDLSHIPEDYQGAPDPMQPVSAYSEGKRLAELLCSIYHKEHGTETVIARCFAFVGPYLNLNIHYAIGNFIRDGLAGGPIRISGDGTPYRSYLYAADLAIWLWTLLFRGKPGEAYNVGSEQAISIRDLAYEVATHFSNSPKVIISKQPLPEAPTERYVPSTRKPRIELGLDTNIHLDEAVRRTVDWNRCLQDF
jgi:dTDP-glucose 4,6-dehydratase